MFRGFSGTLSPPEGISPITGKEIRGADPFREDAEAPGRLLAEGMLGLFLSAAQEHPSIQFRTVEIDRDTDLRVALRNALDRGCTVVETMHRDGRVFTSEGTWPRRSSGILQV